MIRIGLFVITLPGIFFLYETGDHGAEMVFGYGAGTGQLIEQQETTLATSDSLQEGGSTFTVSDNGSWSWEIGASGVSTLLSRFRHAVYSHGWQRHAFPRLHQQRDGCARPWRCSCGRKCGAKAKWNRNYIY